LLADDDEGLAAAAVGLLGDAAERARLGRGGAGVCAGERFRWEAVGERMREIEGREG
jgi:hypothetical protein